MKAKKKEKKKSMCLCGHFGDAPDSDHYDAVEPGHGACKRCHCPRFTWIGFINGANKK
jgi:hypothetical protein